MAVIDAQGTTLTISDGEASPSAVNIGGLISYDGFDGEATDIDITTLASTAMEYRQGLQDYGNLTVELMRDVTDAGQSEMQSAKAALATREFVLTWPDGTTFTFDGYVRSLTAAGGVNDVQRGSASIRITGDVVEGTTGA